MSFDPLLSKSELSKHVEEYINHTIQCTPYDPSLSGTVVQILSGNPLRISDTTNFLDVSDPSIINSKLKAANKNINWHTMRGAIIALRNWGFTSSYDAANDKLKFDIVIHDVECIQASPPTDVTVPDSTSLLEAPFLKNKLNRLKKFHIAEEINAQHPIETAIELIDRERCNASEMTRFADASHLRGRNIGASLESERGPQTFWEYEDNQEKPNPEFPATEPIFQEQNREIEAIIYKRHIQSLPDNQDIFPLSEKYESQPNIFQTGIPEDNLLDYLGELNDDVSIGGRKSQPKERIEEEQNEGDKEPTLKRKFYDVIQKKDSLGSVQGVKKVFHGSAFNSTLEQQKLMKTRENKKLGDSQEFDTLKLLGASLPQSSPSKEKIQPKTTTAKARIAEPKKGTRTYQAPGKEEQKREIREIVPPQKKPSPGVYFDEELEYEIIETAPPRERSNEKKPTPKKLRDIRTYAPPVKNVQQPREVREVREVIRIRDDEPMEISNNDYYDSFKLVKLTPISHDEREARNALFNIRDYDEERRSVHPRNEYRDFEELGYSRPTRPIMSGKTTPGAGLYVEDPFDSRHVIDLSEFEMINFKPATTSMPGFGRK